MGIWKVWLIHLLRKTIYISDCLNIIIIIIICPIKGIIIHNKDKSFINQFISRYNYPYCDTLAVYNLFEWVVSFPPQLGDYLNHSIKPSARESSRKERNPSCLSLNIILMEHHNSQPFFLVKNQIRSKYNSSSILVQDLDSKMYNNAEWINKLWETFVLGD